MTELGALMMALPLLLACVGGLAILGGIVAFIVRLVRGKKKE